MSDFFSFLAHVFPIIKDTKAILLQEVQQGCIVVFVPTKFPSSSMTPSFFCQNYLNLKNFVRFLIVEFLLRFRLKVTSNFFFWFFEQIKE